MRRTKPEIPNWWLRETNVGVRSVGNVIEGSIVDLGRYMSSITLNLISVLYLVSMGWMIYTKSTIGKALETAAPLTLARHVTSRK